MFPYSNQCLEEAQSLPSPRSIESKAKVEIGRGTGENTCTGPSLVCMFPENCEGFPLSGEEL